MTQHRRRIVWKLESLMKKKGINATQLAQELDNLGVTISISQAGRLAYTGPQKISSDLLIAMVKFFDCDIGDLLKTVPGRRVSTEEQIKKKEYVLAWKAPERLEESGLSYREFSAKLESVGVQYDHSNVYRIVTNRSPKRIDIEFLEGAMAIFNCGLTDIVDVE